MPEPVPEAVFWAIWRLMNAGMAAALLVHALDEKAKAFYCGFTLKTTDRTSQPNFTSPISTYTEGKASIRHLPPLFSSRSRTV
jgi:hypothetical protein